MNSTNDLSQAGVAIGQMSFHGFNWMHVAMGVGVAYATHVNLDRIKSALRCFNSAYQWLGQNGGLRGVVGTLWAGNKKP
jgi:hypothetical protein